MMASAPQAIPGRPTQTKPSPPHHVGPSPRGSPKPWGQCFDELSRSLQKICGSPSPFGSTELLHSPTSPRISPVPRLMVSPGPLANSRQNGLANSCSGKPGLLHRAVSSHEQSLQLSPNHRPIMVRHEETEAKLEEMLTQICATQKENERTRQCPQDNAKYSGMQRRDSLKTGVKLNIALEEGVLADNLIVSVNEVNEVNVCLLERNGTKLRILHSSQIPQNTVLENIICNKTKSTLYIRECSTSHLSLYFGGTQTKYLPVIYEDEENLRLRIVFHVPDGITFENVAVKTVDDSVVLLGQQGRSPTLSEGDDSPQLPTKLSKLCFRVDITLPTGTEHRSITAALSRSNQLILIGSLENLSRRYTC